MNDDFRSKFVMNQPCVLAERRDVRLVVQRRGDRSVDVTLERRVKDAMGVEGWTAIDHWYVGPVDSKYFPHGKFEHMTVLIALLLGPLYEAELAEHKRYA